MGLLSALASSFSIGLATPLTAVCVIPLYPGFLAFLSGQDDDAPSVARLGGLVALGVISFMTVLGVVFSTVLQTSLTVVVQYVSPVAFALLAAFSVVLVTGRYPQSRLPTVEPPQTSHPSLSAFGYGLFFGGVVLPCNPGPISVFFARSFLFTDPVTNLGRFLAFGVGMAAPLLAFALVSESWRDRTLGFITGHRRAINVATGVVMFGISVYYLVVVFDVIPVL
jgi:cytochrome c-type biogenesis protein